MYRATAAWPTYTGIYATIKSNDNEYLNMVEIPVKDHVYRITSGGKISMLDLIGASVESFEIIE